MARPIRNMSKILIKVCIVPLWDFLSIIDIFTCIELHARRQSLKRTCGI